MIDSLEHRLSLVIRDLARAGIEIQELHICKGATLSDKRWAEVRLLTETFNDYYKDTKDVKQAEDRSFITREYWVHHDVRVYAQTWKKPHPMIWSYPNG
jgi:hypothetical protein